VPCVITGSAQHEKIENPANKCLKLKKLCWQSVVVKISNRSELIEPHSRFEIESKDAAPIKRGKWASHAQMQRWVDLCGGKFP
jgi:hypothetical protein